MMGPSTEKSLHEFTKVVSIDGSAIDLSNFAGSVVMVVNVASK